MEMTAAIGIFLSLRPLKPWIVKRPSFFIKALVLTSSIRPTERNSVNSLFMVVLVAICCLILNLFERCSLIRAAAKACWSFDRAVGCGILIAHLALARSNRRTSESSPSASPPPATGTSSPWLLPTRGMATASQSMSETAAGSAILETWKRAASRPALSLSFFLLGPPRTS